MSRFHHHSESDYSEDDSRYGGEGHHPSYYVGRAAAAHAAGYTDDDASSVEAPAERHTYHSDDFDHGHPGLAAPGFTLYDGSFAGAQPTKGPQDVRNMHKGFTTFGGGHDGESETDLELHEKNMRDVPRLQLSPPAPGPAPAPAPLMAAAAPDTKVPPKTWHKPLCNCDDCSQFCYSFWCMPCQYGDIRERFDESTCCGCASLFCGCWLIMLSQPIAMCTRNDMREKYVIDQQSNCCCEDVLPVLFCTPCALNQMRTEVDFRHTNFPEQAKHVPKPAAAPAKAGAPAAAPAKAGAPAAAPAKAGAPAAAPAKAGAPAAPAKK
jgi:Cys-rich protein (TIGR01571 family)